MIMIMIKLFWLLFSVSYTLYDDEQIRSIEKISDVTERTSAYEYFYTNTLSKKTSEKTLQAYSREELEQVVNLFKTITFYVQSKTIAIEYLNSFTILEKKNWADKDDYLAMFDALNHSRLFEQAKLFYNQHNSFGLLKPPNVINTINDSSAKTIYALHKSSDFTITSEEFVFSKSVEIIVICHPGCHFCQRAANEIFNDGQLTNILRKNATWLIPPSTRWTFNKFIQWNTRYPNFELKYINQIKDFPSFDDWDTPTFYIVKNGKVLDKIIGWPKEGRIKELKALINKYFHKNI